MNLITLTQAVDILRCLVKAKAGQCGQTAKDVVGESFDGLFEWVVRELNGPSPDWLFSEVGFAGTGLPPSELPDVVRKLFFTAAGITLLSQLWPVLELSDDSQGCLDYISIVVVRWPDGKASAIRMDADYAHYSGTDSPRMSPGELAASLMLASSTMYRQLISARWQQLRQNSTCPAPESTIDSLRSQVVSRIQQADSYQLSSFAIAIKMLEDVFQRPVEVVDTASGWRG